jgi:hypothetical protein
MRPSMFRSLRTLALAAAAVVLLALAHQSRVRAAALDAHSMGGHMTMTDLLPIQPGDRQRADAIVAAARKIADRYTDYHKALADGYVIFHPEIPQNVYHFTDNFHSTRNTLYFDPARPTSLLYEPVPAATPGARRGYKLIGVMYTAPYRATMEELNQRVPLSIARWHMHTNFCVPPRNQWADLLKPDAKFGLQGSIVTESACQAEGGIFLPHVFGWMVHVYPYETDPAKIWAAGMDDDHGMQHDNMPAGMPNMPAGMPM